MKFCRLFHHVGGGGEWEPALSGSLAAKGPAANPPCPPPVWKVCALTSAVRGNDSYHPTFSLVCGVQCSGYSNSLNARRYAEQHQVSAVDSCTRALSLD